MLGSDFPFDMGAPDPRAVVEAHDDLPAEALTRIYEGTAREFLGLGEADGEDTARDAR